MKSSRLFSAAAGMAMIVALLSLTATAQVPQQAPQQQVPQASAASPTTIEKVEVMAEVNGDKIMRNDLAAECLRLHGQAELENQIKKFLIQLECKRLQVTVSAQEIDAEIKRMAETFKFTPSDWLDLLRKERGITPEQYKQDIIWPLLAISKLAGPRLQINEQEIAQEYEARFGAAVQVRQIVLGSQNDAQRIHAEVSANPEAFPSIAKNHSLDQASKPYGGLISPIRRFMLKDRNIEQVVFSLQPGQISPVVQSQMGEFIIFKCEQHLQPQNVDREKVREQLVMKLRDKSMRVVSEQVFRELQSRARIEIILGNPARMGQVPGVAAMVNGENLGMNYLADICLERHGVEVLDDLISRTIIRQACERHNIAITEADLDNEIREMAIKNLPLKVDGSPNTDLMMKLATNDFQVKPEIYRTNTLWPIVALKRLSRNRVQVTEEDIQRSFEANFGEKIRCLAIAFEQKDQRRALEVWEMANNRRTPEHFGDLAEKYSADPESRMARGVIPPISQFCGQPILEKEAFKLLPNEISQILQVDDSLVILYCLGREAAAVTNIEDVKVDLVADIFEKKQKIAMGTCYQELFNQAAFDNYLTGESRNPEVERALREQRQATAAGGATQ